MAKSTYRCMCGRDHSTSVIGRLIEHETGELLNDVQIEALVERQREISGANARPDIDALIAALHAQVDEYGRGRSEYHHDDPLPLVLRHAAAALAAEQERADRLSEAIDKIVARSAGDQLIAGFQRDILRYISEAKHG